MSKFNSETSFLYQLFKGNSNFIVLKHARLFICLFFMIFIINYIQSYVYLCIYTPSYQHFKAFPVSKFNSEISFLYQLFKQDSKFIVIKVIQGYLSAFYDVFVFIFIYTYIYTPSNQHFKAFPVSKINSETSFLYHFLRTIQILLYSTYIG